MTSSFGIRYQRELATLQRILATSSDDNVVMNAFKKVEAKSASGSSCLDVLTIPKSLLVSATSLKMQKNIMQLFLRKVSLLIEELGILKNEETAKKTLAIVKDFWTLCSNQQAVISQKIYGQYSPDLYELLPSLASVFTDLFIAAHRGKDNKEKFSSRLCSWLMFELNERCLKTALLEVAECTPEGAIFLLPVLRKLLSEPPPNDSNLDYLLHFVLLKRWAFCCKDLKDTLQMNLNVKPPKNFVEWLCRRWPQAKDVVPTDKSLKGRRVSELMLDLDQKAIEELIDVFSKILWSADQGTEHGDMDNDGTDEQMFVIDKTGSGKKKNNRGDQPPPKKRRKKEEAIEKELEVSDSPEVFGDSDADSDIFMLPGLLDDIETNNKSRPDKKNNPVLSPKGFVIDRSSDTKITSPESEDSEENMDVEEVESDKESIAEEKSIDNKKSSMPKRTDSVQVIDDNKDSDGESEQSDEEDEDVSLVEDKGPRGKRQLTPTSQIQSYFIDRKKNQDDTALSYFVDKLGRKRSNSKSEVESSVQVIDGMEVQIYVSEDVPSSTEKENKAERGLSPKTPKVKGGEKIERTGAKSPKKSESPSKKRILSNGSAENIESIVDLPRKSLRSKDVEEVIDISRTEVDIDSSEEVKITKVVDTLSATHSTPKTSQIQSVRANSNKNKTPVKNPSEDDDILVVGDNSGESEKPGKPKRKTSESFEDTKKSGNACVSPKQIVDLTTEAHIGNVLSQIRKSVDSLQGSKSQDRNTLSRPSKLTTRLRSKSESLTDGSKGAEKNSTRQALTGIKSKSSSKKDVSASSQILTDWLRKGPMPVGSADKSTKHEDQSDQSTPVRKLRKKSVSESSQGNKIETDGTLNITLSPSRSSTKRKRPEDEVFGEPLKTYSKKERQTPKSTLDAPSGTSDVVLVESDSSTSMPQSSGKAKKSPLKKLSESPAQAPSDSSISTPQSSGKAKKSPSESTQTPKSATQAPSDSSIPMPQSSGKAKKSPLKRTQTPKSAAQTPSDSSIPTPQSSGKVKKPPVKSTPTPKSAAQAPSDSSISRPQSSGKMKSSPLKSTPTRKSAAQAPSDISDPVVVVESDSESSISTPKGSGQAKKSPLKRTYYLRTTHKISPMTKHDSSACSDEKLMDESTEHAGKATPKSKRKSGASSLPGTPKDKISPGNKRKSLRLAKK